MDITMTIITSNIACFTFFRRQRSLHLRSYRQRYVGLVGRRYAVNRTSSEDR